MMTLIKIGKKLQLCYKDIMWKPSKKSRLKSQGISSIILHSYKTVQ